MKSTYVLDTNNTARVVGYKKIGNKWSVNMMDVLDITGDGNIFSTMDDVIKWNIGFNKLFEKKTLKLIFSSGKYDYGKYIEYGFGWNIYKNSVNHSGGWLGTSTFIGRYPNNTYVIILSNDEDADTQLIGKHVHQLIK